MENKGVEILELRGTCKCIPPFLIAINDHHSCKCVPVLEKNIIMDEIVLIKSDDQKSPEGGRVRLY